MKFAKREKYFVSIAACLVALFFLFQFLIFPFFEKKDRLQRGIKAKEDGLKEIVALASEYLDHKKNSQSMDRILAQRKRKFSLFSFLERAADVAKVKNHMKYMKPSVSKGTGPYKESMIEIKLEAITLNQLVDYLYRIEKPEDLVYIKRISINDNKREAGYLDSILQVLTFQ